MGLRAVAKTWESVELSWKQGFDGGYQQNFTLTYIRHSNSEFLKMTSKNVTKMNITGEFSMVLFLN